MKKRLKRICSILICACMLTQPLITFAESAEGKVEAETLEQEQEVTVKTEESSPDMVVHSAESDVPEAKQETETSNDTVQEEISAQHQIVSIRAQGGGTVRITNPDTSIVEVRQDSPVEIDCLIGSVLQVELIPDTGYEVSTYRVLMDSGSVNKTVEDTSVLNAAYTEQITINSNGSIEAVFLEVQKESEEEPQVPTEESKESSTEQKPQEEESKAEKKTEEQRASGEDTETVDKRLLCDDPECLTKHVGKTLAPSSFPTVMGIKGARYRSGISVMALDNPTVGHSTSGISNIQFDGPDISAPGTFTLTFLDGDLAGNVYSGANCLNHGAANPGDANTRQGNYTATITEINQQAGTITWDVVVTPPGVCAPGSIVGYQRVGGAFMTAHNFSGAIEIYKSSATPTITNNNSAYSLAGAVYGIYNQNGDEVTRVVTDGNGYAKADNIAPGNYTIREITPPKGYALDGGYTNITLNGGSTARVNVKDYPQSDPVGILLGKIDRETNLNRPQGSASLENAEFTVKYYTGFHNTDPAASGQTPVRTWVIKTDSDGFCNLDSNYKVSGDDFYYASNGLATLPLGTITIQETKAPVGYLLNDQVFVRQITPNGTTEGVNTYNAPTVPETPQKGVIRLEKKDADMQTSQGTATLQGAVYEVKDSLSNVVDTITTDASGKASTKELALGTYTVKEKTPSPGYMLDTTEHSVVIAADNTTDRVFYRTVTSYEQVMLGGVKIEKRDRETNRADAQGAATLQGATFEITTLNDAAVVVEGKTYSKGQAVKSIVTGANGQAATANNVLPYGRYRITETIPPNGYLNSGENMTQEFSITQHGVMVDLTTNNTAVKNDIIRGDVEIIKLKENEDEDNDTLQGLEGIEFTFTSNTTGKVVKTITTDKNGFATTADAAYPNGGLVFDTYTVTETKYPAGLKPIEPFEVTISENGVTLKGIYKEDKLIVSPVTVVKVDKSTGKVIPIANTKFRLLDENKKPITMTTHYPNTVVHEIFQTDENGQFTFPDKLKYGTYYLEEIEAPAGYLKGELLKFQVTNGATWEKPLIIEYADENTMGQIEITKQDAETKELLSGAVFEVRAAQDIVTPDGTVRLTKGALADTITIDKKGKGTSQSLFLGKYEITEKKQPSGFILSKKSYPVELTYKDQSTPVVTESLTVKNTPTEIQIKKTDEESGKALQGVSFYIWNKDMISDVDPEMGVKQEYVTDEKGLITIKRLPPGTYCVQESKPLPGYVLDETIYEMVIGTDGLIDGEYVGILQLKNTHTKLLKTTATDKDTKTHEAIPKKATTFVDALEFDSMQIGETYTIKGKLMDKATKKPLLIDGKEVTAKKTFVAQKADEIVEVEYHFDASGLKGKEIVVFEKVYIGNVEIAAHEDFEDQDQTIRFPLSEIGTTAADKDTGTHEAIAKPNTTIVDTVTYTDLIVSQEYTLKGVLMDKETKKPLLINDKEVRAEKVFKPEQKSGSVELEFTFDASGLKGKEIVVFEKVYAGDAEIAAHEDFEDQKQTIKFPFSEIRTTATDKETGTHEAIAKANITIVDTVTYTNLIVGQEYTLKGVLMDKATKKPLLINEKEVRAEKVFKPEQKSGSVELEFTFDASGLNNQEIVVFEKLYAYDTEVAVHEDINDEGQTVKIKLGKLSVKMPGNNGGGRIRSIKTGDDTTVLLAMVLMLSISGAVIVTYAKARKRGRKDE